MRYKVLLLFLLLSGCGGLNQGNRFHLTPVQWYQVKGWEEDNLKEALPAVLKSCEKAPDSMINFCRGLNAHLNDNNADLRAYFEKTLKPYQVSAYGSTTGKITGYYEAELTGTREQENGAQVPIYGLPDNYVAGQKTDTREEIETSCSNAPIIAWADDPVELFIAQVQGSGRLTTPSGEVIHLGYAGNNGYAFTGIGTILKDEGIEGLHSMGDIRSYLQAHPKEATGYMRQNKRYIYFREIEGETPYGTAGVVLTPERSVAVDNKYIPMHTIMFLNTTKPDKTPVHKLVMAQDTGAAIKGGIRADYFFGHGEAAFQTAGQMNQVGSYYLLMPKG